MGRAVRTVVGLGLVIVGLVNLNPAFVKAGFLLAASAGAETLQLALSPRRSNLTAFDPRQINTDPAAPRKLVLGRTAMPVDLKYAEPSGSNQEFVDYIFVLAAHKSDAIEEIYIEEDLAWTAAGGAQGKYVGYLTITTILEAGPSAFHTVNAGTKWGSSTRMTGCTTMQVRVKRSDNNKNSQSPFGSGIAGRWTVIGRGIPVYDPARDSTVPGGSGTQRVTNQATWAYSVSGVARGNNPALQLLAYLIGWRIGGVISVGAGLPADVIDMPSFAAAAAICDESVAIAGGGSQRRYESGIAFADSDDPLAIIQTLLAAMNGELIDDGGRLGLRLAVNDLTASITLTDDDFVSGYEWRPQPAIAEQYTVVRGRYTQPNAPSLFSMVDYPEVAIPRTSQIPRPMTLELRAVQDQRRAQRIARQAAIRQLYRGQFIVTLGVRGWQLRRNAVVAVTSNARGWNAKLFRVRSIVYNTDATVEVVLQEENAAIYAWSTSDESALVTPVAPIVFDTRNANSWLMANIEPEANDTRVELPAMPKGEWGTGFAYKEGDIVFRASVSYVAKTDHTSSISNAPPSAEWEAITPGPDPSFASASISAAVTNTTYGTTPVASFTVETKGGTSVQLSANTSVLASVTNIDPVQAAAKWQRWNGSTWVDVASESTSVSVNPNDTEPFNFAATATGLASNTAYDFRVLARIIRTVGTDDLSLQGTATGQGL